MMGVAIGDKTVALLPCYAVLSKRPAAIDRATPISRFQGRGNSAPRDKEPCTTANRRKNRRKGHAMTKPKDTGDTVLTLVKKQENPGAESKLEKDLERARDAARAVLKELGVSACFMILMDERRDEAMYSHAVWGENIHHLRMAITDAVKKYEAIELIIDPTKEYRSKD